VRTSFARGKVRPRLLGLGVFVVGLACVAPAAAQEATSGAGEYSAYSDPEKTALAVILSEEENVEEFRAEFGLDDGEVERALAAVREENEVVAEEFAESEEIVAANRELSDAEISAKIAASDYEETLEGSIAETKDSVAALLPGEDESDLEAWVDGQWEDEARRTSEGDGRVVETRAGTMLKCRVFATQYIGHTRFEVALPHRTLKFNSQPRVLINNEGRLARPRVREVGPWNTYDNYWTTGRRRTMWKNLPRCMPEARAAYFRNYNRGRDEFGRKVTNPAGVDLTPTMARRLGLGRYENGWVYVRFPWVRS
jgi:hypothetical protein